MRILPREDAFVGLFTQQAGVLHEAAGVLLDLMEGTGKDIRERANHKWKEIFEVLEFAADKAEDVSDVLQTIVLKSA